MGYISSLSHQIVMGGSSSQYVKYAKNYLANTPAGQIQEHQLVVGPGLGLNCVEIDSASPNCSFSLRSLPYNAADPNKRMFYQKLNANLSFTDQELERMYFPEATGIDKSDRYLYLVVDNSLSAIDTGVVCAIVSGQSN